VLIPANSRQLAAQSVAALPFDLATRPEYLAQVKEEFDGIKALFA